MNGTANTRWASITSDWISGFRYRRSKLCTVPSPLDASKVLSSTCREFHQIFCKKGLASLQIRLQTWQGMITTLQKLETNSSKRLKVITLLESELLRSHLRCMSYYVKLDIKYSLHWFTCARLVFQARPWGPDQGKSSFLYLTIPTLQCHKRPKRVRFIGENKTRVMRLLTFWQNHPHPQWQQCWGRCRRRCRGRRRGISGTYTWVQL